MFRRRRKRAEIPQAIRDQLESHGVIAIQVALTHPFDVETSPLYSIRHENREHALAWLAEKQEAAERRHRWIVVGTVAGNRRGDRQRDRSMARCQRLSARMAQLILKRASASRPGGEWDDDDYDVVTDGVTVGRIMKAAAAPVGTPWMWTLGWASHEDRTPTHGYEATREAAIRPRSRKVRRRENSSAVGSWAAQAAGCRRGGEFRPHARRYAQKSCAAPQIDGMQERKTLRPGRGRPYNDDAVSGTVTIDQRNSGHWGTGGDRGRRRPRTEL